MSCGYCGEAPTYTCLERPELGQCCDHCGTTESDYAD